MTGAPATFLFTDLASTGDLRVGDAQTQRVLQAHHRLLNRCVAAHDGQEVRWLGDGLMTMFAAPADAVRCAIALQQAARRRAARERLALRVGLNVGETKRDESDAFGIPVAIARSLCQRADAGQILCSGVVPGLLVGQEVCEFRDCGPLEITGLATVPSCEVLYRHDQPTALLTHTPFVGRVSELTRLDARLQETRAGQGGLVLLAGEPGIGKTRTLEEFAETARATGAQVLWGRCYEGEAARPYGPFAEALGDYAHSADLTALSADLGAGAGPLARLLPVLRERLPDLPEPAALQPDEERVRLLDAVVQFLIALATGAPLVVALDDLHWADAATVALLRHVARFAPRHGLLLLGTYRDVEVNRAHPLADALGALPRETAYEHLALGGLNRTEVAEFLEAVADEKVADVLVNAMSEETSGNPFFIREVLLHLVEEGKIVWRERAWTTAVTERVALPEGARQVILRRLARLPERASRLLRAAAGFSGSFRFDVVARVAGLNESDGLDALDDVLAAQLLRAGDAADSFDFTHALVRHTLYADLSPPRQARLHRQIAEGLEQSDGASADQHAGEIAEHFHRSASLPGAVRGIPYALCAAEHAERTYAHDDAAAFLRIALALLPQGDARRGRILARLGMALSWTLNFDAGLPMAGEAGDLIAADEGNDAAADYLAEAAMAVWGAGATRAAWSLAAQGLRYVGDRRDMTWVRLMANDIVRREAEDTSNPGIVIDTAERRAVAAVAERLPMRRDEVFLLGMHGFIGGKSRQDILQRFCEAPFWMMAGAGEYRTCLRLWEARIAQDRAEGRIADVIECLAHLARCHSALGELPAATSAYDEGRALAQRLSGHAHRTGSLVMAALEMHMVVDEGWDDFIREQAAQHANLMRAASLRNAQHAPAENRWGFAAAQAVTAWLCAWMGQQDQALLVLQTIVDPLERAPGWASGYEMIPFGAAATLWLTQRTDHIDAIERNLREKILAADFRFPMVDARQSMAHLSALQGRHDEASDWFAQARVVLDEQGARPLRAIVDFDEALMYHRRAAPGDAERAHPLLAAALEQFRPLGMTGWIRRAEALLGTSVATSAISEPERVVPVESLPPVADARTAPVAVLRREGDYWTLSYDGSTSRLRHSRGLHYLAHLLKHPGQEYHALDLVQGTGGRAQDSENPGPGTRDAGLEILDPAGKAAYKRRLVELREELEEAEERNDIGRVARARAEIEAITEQLAAAVGLGRRNRMSASAAERARSTVTKRVKDAIDKIAGTTPALGDHLSGRVRPGTFCVYVPDATSSVVWEL